MHRNTVQLANLNRLVHHSSAVQDIFDPIVEKIISLVEQQVVSVQQKRETVAVNHPSTAQLAVVIILVLLLRPACRLSCWWEGLGRHNIF